MGYDVHNDTVLAYGYALPVEGLRRLEYHQRGGDYPSRVVNWRAVVSRRPGDVPSLASLAAETLVGSHSREQIAAAGMPSHLHERFVDPILAGRFVAAGAGRVAPPAAPAEDGAARGRRRRDDFNWSAATDGWECGEADPFNASGFVKAARRVLCRFREGPHARLLPAHKIRSSYSAEGRHDSEVEDYDDSEPEMTTEAIENELEDELEFNAIQRHGCLKIHVVHGYCCMDGDSSARVFLTMPDLTESWAPCYRTVNEVSVVPRERDIDGLARYCFEKVARELLGDVIPPSARPRFFYLKAVSGG